MKEEFREIGENGVQSAPKEPAPEEAGVGESAAESASPAEPELGEAEKRKAVVRSPYALGIFGIFAIVAIMVITSGFIVIERAQRRANEARNRLALGQAALVDGDTYLALYHFTIALELNPRLPGAHSALGRIAITNKQADNAVRHLNAELAVNPGDRLSHLALGCLYALGCIPADDPHTVRPYLLRRFREVLLYEWPEDLVFVPGPDIDALSRSVYHFQYAAENLPDDPAPHIGLALTEIANYNLDTARTRLAALVGRTADENTILVAQNIIQDINREEQYQAMTGIETDAGSVVREIPPEAVPVPPLRDYGEGLEPLPPMADMSGAEPEVQPVPAPPAGGFGERGLYPPADTSGGRGDLGFSITRENLMPRPTVKPISNDVRIEATNEWVHTVRIANIYQQGNVGFREGETIVMPVTNTEVKVVEVEDDRIVLEERQHSFEWVRGQVGWTLKSVDGIPENAPAALDITARPPGEEASAEDNEEPAADSDESETGEDGESTPEEELGPEVAPQ